MLTRFQLGYANRTLGYRLPASNRVTGADMRGRLQKLGILRESGHEKLHRLADDSNCQFRRRTHRDVRPYDHPTDEIERRCNEYQKSRILKEGDAVSDRKDLPAGELLQQFVSRKLRRS
jgi:hypothetical protein